MIETASHFKSGAQYVKMIIGCIPDRACHNARMNVKNNLISFLDIVSRTILFNCYALLLECSGK